MPLLYSLSAPSQVFWWDVSPPGCYGSSSSIEWRNRQSHLSREQWGDLIGFLHWDLRSFRLTLRQRKGHVRIAGFCAQLASTTGGDNHILVALNLVSAGGGIAPGIELEFPEQLAGLLVESVKLFIL